MTKIDLLAERHVREYEARLHRIDELIERASKTHEQSEQLVEEVKTERDNLNNYLEDLKHKSPELWMESGGPMVMWDILAERLENLVERIEH